MKTVEQILLERIHELESELDGVKTDLAHEVDRLQKLYDETEDQLNRVEDAADYWKETFETFYNAIYIATARPSESHSDGDCIEEIIDKLKAYNGESDELHELKY